MEYLKIDGEFPRLSKSAVTLGKFDGIHRGHQKLVEKILEQKEKGLQTVLFSLGFGSAAAQSVILFVIIMIITLIMFRIEKKGVNY